MNGDPGLTKMHGLLLHLYLFINVLQECFKSLCLLLIINLFYKQTFQTLV